MAGKGYPCYLFLPVIEHALLSEIAAQAPQKKRFALFYLLSPCVKRVQANKNLLLKARVGTDAVTASVAFKAWWQPSFTFALSGGYNMQKRKPQIGFVFNCENYGNIRCSCHTQLAC